MSARFISLLTALCTIIIVFVAISILEVGLIVLFYFTGLEFPDLAIILTFSIAGIFAAALSFDFAIRSFQKITRRDQMNIVALQLMTGLISFFLLSRIEGREYEAAFKGFGAALALGSLLFISKNNS